MHPHYSPELAYLGCQRATFPGAEEGGGTAWATLSYTKRSPKYGHMVFKVCCTFIVQKKLCWYEKLYKSKVLKVWLVLVKV